MIRSSNVVGAHTLLVFLGLKVNCVRNWEQLGSFNV